MPPNPIEICRHFGLTMDEIKANAPGNIRQIINKIGLRFQKCFVDVTPMPIWIYLNNFLKVINFPDKIHTNS